MTKTLRIGFAAAIIGAAMTSMAGCTGSQLANAVGTIASTAPGGTNGNPSQSGGSCPTVTAGGTSTGTSSEGVYANDTLPASFTAYTTEDQITTRITGFADAAKTSDTSAQNTWTQFKCLYAPAVAAWRTKTGRTD